MIANSFLMRRSAKAIDKTASKRAVRWWRTAPDPGLRMSIELGSGDARGVGDVFVASQRDAGEGFAAEDTPPALDEVQPRGANGNEGVLDARMRGADARRGCAVSQSRIGPLLWLARLSATR